jgi:hypothetical protein
MWRYLALCTVALLTACAELSPSRGGSAPGAPPQRVAIELTSQVQYTPLPPEVLGRPGVQAAIAQCEHQGWERCREFKKPADSRTYFVRTQDEQVFVFVKLGGLEPDRAYEVRFRLFDPEGNMRMRVSTPFHIPSGALPDFNLDFVFQWGPPDPSTWQLGRWRVEVAVNGQVEGERTFEVVDRTR